MKTLFAYFNGILFRAWESEGSTGFYKISQPSTPRKDGAMISTKF
jgi:hypothetical protein